MRVTGGELRGRTLRAPKGLGVRPTSDRVRESLFSILGGRCAGARVLDLYAGTGALGIEALSRGAACVVSVERHPGHARVLADNAAALRLGERLRVLRLDASHAAAALRRQGEPPFALVFCDAPYAEPAPPALFEGLRAAGLLAPEALLVVEHARDAAPDAAGLSGFTVCDRRRYGDTHLGFLTPSESEHPA